MTGSDQCCRLRGQRGQRGQVHVQVCRRWCRLMERPGRRSWKDRRAVRRIDCSGCAGDHGMGNRRGSADGRLRCYAHFTAREKERQPQMGAVPCGLRWLTRRQCGDAYVICSCDRRRRLRMQADSRADEPGQGQKRDCASLELER